MTFIILLGAIVLAYWGTIRYHYGWPISENKEVLQKLRGGKYQVKIEKGNFPVIIFEDDGEVDAVISTEEFSQSLFGGRYIRFIPMIHKYHFGYLEGEEDADFVQVKNGSELYKEMEKIFEGVEYSEQVHSEAV